jgi:dTDP-4-dehydrorhamnose 3,5-epimerase
MLEKKLLFSDAFSFVLKKHVDLRGTFVKTYNVKEFQKLNLNITWQEQYISVSKRGTLRGLHFQMPPFSHDKVVVCLDGVISDVVLDLRKSSKTFGQHMMFKLSPFEGVYVPAGFAHGFCVSESESATLLYNTSQVYSAEHDTGLLWNDFGIDWPIADPILSPRDQSFPKFSDFVSPFN